MFILEIYSQMAESILAAARSFAQILENKFKKAIEKLDEQIPPTVFDQQPRKLDLFSKKSPNKIDEKLFEGLKAAVEKQEALKKQETLKLLEGLEEFYKKQEANTTSSKLLLTNGEDSSGQNSDSQDGSNQSLDLIGNGDTPDNVDQ